MSCSPSSSCRGSFDGGLRLSDYSSDLVILSFLLLVVSALAVLWIEVSVSSPKDFLHFLVLPWVVVVPLHEGIHALAARFFGARLRFGLTTFGKIIFAPYIAIETPLRVGQYLAVSLAPLSISAGALALAWLLRSDFWALVYIFNTAGMAGDLLTAIVLLRMPSNARVFDDGTTLRSNTDVPLAYPRWISPLLKLAVLLVFVVIIIFGRVEVVVENG